MSSMQMISARIGRVTGHGLAGNMCRIFPAWAVTTLVALLFIANTINIGGDLAAMGAAAELVLGWGRHVFTLLFAVTSLILQVLVPYHRYVRYLKWLTLVLFAYVGVVLTVEIEWTEVALRTVAPQLALTGATATMVVAIFGTTIIRAIQPGHHRHRAARRRPSAPLTVTARGRREGRSGDSRQSAEQSVDRRPGRRGA
ncbi:divalent metal cation transporter [Sinorhizobium meliloti]|nr:divalent metal cation transporter [Sinorhizobium meliloti]